MTCDICFDYGIQTVAIKENGKDIEICFWVVLLVVPVESPIMSHQDLFYRMILMTL